ncbi:MAG: 1-acyl-sn-glycerol-3-phosphate acyltransferase [Piscinibacter sp.]|nr:1-acyl-sn-glycerol-3-phosphate acyltransferase [Piscinibacter sp.]
MRVPRACWRLLRVLLHGLHGALVCAFLFPFLTPPLRMQRVGWWSAKMLRMLGIGLRHAGSLHAGPLLVVANHVSWLDILAINAVHPVRFVSKADVRHWPLLGWLVACGGTLFIERERKRDALRVVHQVAEALRGGEIVAVFPEGTTSDGLGVLPFHANLLQAAIATAAPVQPLVLRYCDAHAPVSPAAPYIGETSLAESLWAVAMADGLVAQVRVEPAQATAHADRRALAGHLREIIAARLDSGEMISPAS